MRYLFSFPLTLLLFLSACSPSRQSSQDGPAASAKTNPLLEVFTHAHPTYPLVSAHRGGKRYDGYPENAIATFDYVLSHTPALLECDVEMTLDSTLLLMHDRSLERTTTGKGLVREKNWEDIQDLHLVDDFGTATPYTIPTLEETLQWADENGAVLSLDVKRGVPFKKVIAQVEQHQAEDNVVIITYSVGAARRVYELNPRLMISVGIRTEEALQRHLDAGIPPRNIIAFVGVSEAAPGLYDKLHALNISCILGTMGNLDNKAIAVGDQLYRQLIESGADILATDRPIEAAEAIAPLVPKEGKASSFWKEREVRLRRK